MNTTKTLEVIDQARGHGGDGQKVRHRSWLAMSLDAE